MTGPRIRAGDADRQRSVDILARHFTEGRLDGFEYDERVRKAYASIYLDELPALFTDLPPEPKSIDAYGSKDNDGNAYEKAWRRGYGPLDRPMFSGSGPVRPRRRVPQIIVFVFAAITMLLLVAVTHGLFFPFPLIFLGWLGLSGARRGHRRPGPGPRR